VADRRTEYCRRVMDRELPGSENRKLMFPRMAAKLLNAWPTHLDIRINTSTVNRCIVGESIGSGAIDPKMVRSQDHLDTSLHVRRSVAHLRSRKSDSWFLWDPGRRVAAPQASPRAGCLDLSAEATG